MEQKLDIASIRIMNYIVSETKNGNKPNALDIRKKFPKYDDQLNLEYLYRLGYIDSINGFFSGFLTATGIYGFRPTAKLMKFFESWKTTLVLFFLKSILVPVAVTVITTLLILLLNLKK
ncbi:MAG TPA: hypothetical protein H9820_05510 [Candidatus Companilactobacillus pullicola]|uniref:Uncharacterized protein n=1 Tax=Candidatus Companilactobacillus pullicola TaxID=2838523 RepID=A0A9D2CNF6_9LACO|nr:hypothetical protein [Candidatus Companilactobacillus pullicola]